MPADNLIMSGLARPGARMGPSTWLWVYSKMSVGSTSPRLSPWWTAMPAPRDLTSHLGDPVSPNSLYGLLASSGQGCVAREQGHF